MNKCFELCKLCSWSGAAQAFCNMKWQDQIQTVADLRDYLSDSQRSGQWYVENLIAAVEKFRTQQGGDAPKQVKGAGHMLIGQTTDGYVAIEFHDPDWWLHLTPREARNMASLIVKHADDLEKGSTHEKT